MDAASDPSVEMLLEHHAFVRSLARRIAGDGDEADELEQEAWAVALERPPRDPGSARGWLARVMRNVAWTRRRGALRRREYEGRVAAGEEGGEDPRALAERMVLAQRVVTAVLALDETQRTVVLLRHVRGMEVDAIAGRLGLPRETVRTRLRRAHERLRAQLDREHGGREGWAPALLAFARRPERAAGPLAGVMTGGLIVGMKFALVCGAVVAVGAFWWSRSRAGEARVPERDPVAEASVAAENTQRVAEPRVVPASPVRGTAGRSALVRSAPGTQDAAGWWLVGELVGVAGAQMSGVLELAEAPRMRSWKSMAVGARYELSLDELFHERTVLPLLHVRIDHPDFLRSEQWIELPARPELAPGERFEVQRDLELVPAAGFVTGRVQRVAGNADEGIAVALVRLDELGQPGPRAVDEVVCEEDGSFRLRAEQGGDHALVATPIFPYEVPTLIGELCRPATERVKLAHDGESVARSLTLETGLSISGRLVDLEGAPVVGDMVSMKLADESRPQTEIHGRDLTWIHGRYEHAGQVVETAADGSFQFDGLSSLEVRVIPGAPALDWSTPGDDDIRGHAFTHSERPPDVQLVKPPSSGIELVQRVHRFLIEVRSEGSPVPRPEIRWTMGPGGFSTSQDACLHGRHGIAFPEWMEIKLDVKKAGYVSAHFTLPEDAAGSDGVFPVQLERAPDAANLSLSIHTEIEQPELALYVRYTEWPDGSPRPGASHLSESVRGEVDTEGRLKIGALPSGRWLLQVSSDSQHTGLAPSFVLSAERVVELAPGEDAVREFPLRSGGQLQVIVPLVAGGVKLSAQVFTAGGEDRELRFNSQGNAHGRTKLAPGLNVGAGALEAGDYELQLRRGRHQLEPLPFRIELGELTELRIELED